MTLSFEMAGGCVQAIAAMAGGTMGKKELNEGDRGSYNMICCPTSFLREAGVRLVMAHWV